MRTTYNKIVIVEDNIITVLNDSFIHSDDFKGLTGTQFEIVSEDSFYNTIEDYLGDDLEVLKYYANNLGNVTSEMIESVDSSEEALKELFFDLSYEELWDYMREELNLSTDEAYIFNCVGGGRCFNKNDKFTHNKELEYLLEEFEG